MFLVEVSPVLVLYPLTISISSSLFISAKKGTMYLLYSSLVSISRFKYNIYSSAPS
uniref:Uncharacterized protein n=1 Tax=uncultured marine virus TaxID=186617 RepID=A0A0F7L347_9VIRU|nr:hypothetical protein [uncultured marine virus]